MDVYVISRVIGTVHLDQTAREEHDSTLRVTENPIESGAVIADHAALEPRRLTIQGKMVDWLAAGVNVAPASGIYPRVSPEFLNIVPMPARVQTFTNETSFQAARLLSPAASYAGGVVGLNIARPLAPWLPDFAPVDTLDMSSGTKRVEQVYDNLRAVQKSGDPVEIVTGSQHYENMLLVAVGMSQHYDGSAEISITAQEIFIVETQTVSGITVAGAPGSGTSANKSGRASAQSLATKNKGNVQIPEASDGTKRSALRALLDWGKGGQS
jgi:hypothetical protein